MMEATAIDLEADLNCDDVQVHFVEATPPSATTLGGSRPASSMYQPCTNTPVDSGE